MSTTDFSQTLQLNMQALPEKNLHANGLRLPAVELPAFNYEPLSVHNSVVYLAGQLAKENGEVVHRGRANIEVTETEAARQMQVCALQALAVLKHHFEALENIQRILHLNVYVACDHKYEGISKLADHASNVFICAFGDAGRHPRSVLGVNRLPQNAPVMIDLRVSLMT
jgi:enamine deaminase RidA (YjgF/YER057c/UK114 family)